MKKYVEKKFKRIKLLMQFLTILKSLCDEFDCQKEFGFSGFKLQDKVYELIAKLSAGG